jgi:hypothetical protein
VDIFSPEDYFRNKNLKMQIGSPQNCNFIVYLFVVLAIIIIIIIHIHHHSS